MVTNQQQPTPWQRSSYCGTNARVEVYIDTAGQRVYLRDGKHPDYQPLILTLDQWNDFIGGVMAGEFEWAPAPAAERPDPACERHGCKHPFSGHIPEDEDPWRSCRVEGCTCRGFSGWSGQNGRAS